MELHLQIIKLNKFKIFYFCTFLILSPGCKKEAEPEDLLAKIGDRRITMDEFELFYELDPNFGIDSSGYPALSDELDKYIDQVLAKQKAETNSLLKDIIFTRAIEWESRQALLRQLYREVTKKSIDITEQEQREEFLQSNQQVMIRHLFNRERKKVEEWLKRLNQGENFENLAESAFSDSVLANNGGNLGWIAVKDLDDDIAEAISNLEMNEIVGPVQTRWGYHIVQLLHRKVQVILREDEYNKQHQSLFRRIKYRKGRKLLNKFIADYIGSLNPQPDENTFREMWNAVVPITEHEKGHISFKINLTDDLINSVTQKLDPILDQPLIKFKGGSISLSSYLKEIKKIPPGNRPRFQSPRELSNQIGNWVRDELLLQEARRLGIERHDRVKLEIEKFVQEQSYYFYLEEELNNLKIPDTINHYFQAPISERAGIRKDLDKFHTLEEWRWRQAEKLIHIKLRKFASDIWVNQNLLLEKSKQINWDRRIPMIMMRKPS